ncbi:IclR family transcriptional regulator [Sulfitobacter sp. F26204]|uniref:IclR family transcriptional regulator n=1 Tax=Sulfitobacter sp. F26204 TaxID=2996014 RepID=UPI00225E1FCA|nr:IclR family transcriptional regulator [Sulfitobacter sp. F26204]MCX7560404.1 IclR family transcriptional regulator [Sulfitobacter sp. F26204]
MTKSKQNTLFVGTLAKGLRVLRAFDETHTELSLVELASLTGLDKSAVQRLANTLHLEGMLDKDPVTRRYRPTHAWLQLAYAYYWSNPLVARAMPKLIDLSQRLGETVNLAELSGDRIIYTARLPCTRTIFAASVPGRTVPALNTSAGQVILATHPSDERDAAIRDWHLHAHTSRTTLDRAEIARQIGTVVQNGFAITHDQMILSEIGIACAIRGPDSRGRAAVHCSVSAHHWDEARIKAKILPWLLDAANAISPILRP